MSPDKQRIAIAEACGWRRCSLPSGRWLPPNEGNGDLVRDENGLPFYLTDLNAMHEAEKTLGDQQSRLFRHWLYRVLDTDRDPISATAAQRAEAFLRTIGKWEDDK